jgi:hypothetical protein
MNFYKSLEPYLDYLVSIRKLKEYLSFDLSFPSKWTIPKSLVDKLQVVNFESDKTDFRGLSFVTEMKDENVTFTLDSIDKIIKVNKEREMKEKLFKVTIEQLKHTFEKNDLGKLKKLYFDFDLNENLDNDEQDGQEPTTIELAE